MARTPSNRKTSSKEKKDHANTPMRRLCLINYVIIFRWNHIVVFGNGHLCLPALLDDYRREKKNKHTSNGWGGGRVRSCDSFDTKASVSIVLFLQWMEKKRSVRLFSLILRWWSKKTNIKKPSGTRNRNGNIHTHTPNGSYNVECCSAIQKLCKCSFYLMIAHWSMIISIFEL